MIDFKREVFFFLYLVTISISSTFTSPRFIKKSKYSSTCEKKSPIASIDLSGKFLKNYYKFLKKTKKKHVFSFLKLKSKVKWKF